MTGHGAGAVFPGEQGVGAIALGRPGIEVAGEPRQHGRNDAGGKRAMSLSITSLDAGPPPNREFELSGFTGDATLDALLSGLRWAATDLTYAFPATEADWSMAIPASVLSLLAPPESFQRAADLILAGTTTIAGGPLARFGSVASFTQLSFARAEADEAPTLRLGLAENFTDFGLYGFAYYPGSESVFSSAQADRGVGGDVWLTADLDEILPGSAFFVDGTPFGGNDWRTMMHEIGHALGLAHPFEGPSIGGAVTIPGALNGNEFSVMAYAGPPGGSFFQPDEQGNAPQSWMIYDIRALQHLYGANYATEAGDTTYRWDPGTGEMSINGVGQGAAPVNRILLSIWDGGGRDTYDASAYGSAVVIDLRPGHGSLLSDIQRAILFDGDDSIVGETGPVVRAQANVWNTFLVNDDPRSLIEDAIGGDGDDRLTGNQAANHLRGGGGADTLDGGAGADTLAGGAGADSLAGGTGNDLYHVDDAADAMLETALGGYDVVVATAAYTLRHHVEELRLAEAAGAASGTGNGAANRLSGNGAANHLAGGGGDDSLSGLGGHDRLTGQAGRDLLTGGTGDDTLLGGSEADTLNGETGRDSLAGGDGNDLLIGGIGADVMRGGRGDDSYRVDGTGDRAIESAGEGYDQVLSSVDHRLGAEIERLDLTGDARIGIGNAGANTIFGTASDNRLDGLGGDDSIVGVHGADTLLGGDGHDSLTAIGDDDLLMGGDGDDYLFSSLGYGVGGDRLVGGAGNDTLEAADGANTLEGGTGADELFGGSGSDRLLGGDGHDTLWANRRFGDPDGAADTLRGGAGDDVYRKVEAGDIVREADGEGADTIEAINGYVLPSFVEVLLLTAGDGRGNALHNGVYGGADSSWLRGMAGDDTIGSGLGDDTLSGGAGFDAYYYNASAGGRDVIWDFSLTEDLVWLDGLFADATAVLAALSDQAGGATLLLPGDHGSITFRGIRAAQIDADEFFLG